MLFLSISNLKLMFGGRIWKINDGYTETNYNFVLLNINKDI